MALNSSLELSYRPQLLVRVTHLPRVSCYTGRQLLYQICRGSDLFVRNDDQANPPLDGSVLASAELDDVSGCHSEAAQEI